MSSPVWLMIALSLALGLLGCGTFHSHNGPRADAPRIYSGLRLDWAAISGDAHYIQQYALETPPLPILDLPLSFALDSLFLPLTLPRTIYQILAVPAGGW